VKKIVLVSVIFSLILLTAIIKNTAKKIEDKLFTTRENLRVLKSEYENILLEHDYLSSAEKLLEFQSLYFEDQLIQKNIKNIKIYNISKNQNNIKDLKIIKE
tara:strand:- start:334 stop:639 length:306 start_codon:yes stop_codon:yes gene_type:complete